MIKKFSISMASLAVLAFMLGGCTGGEPYVQNPSEYDREAASFAKGPIHNDGSEIYVCYAKSNATPAQVRVLAENECGRFGLGAVFIGQNYELCPLMTPMAAGFECTAQTARAAVPNAPMPAASGAPIGAGTAPVSASQTGISAGDVSTDAKSQPFPTFLFDKTPRTVDPQ